MQADVWNSVARLTVSPLLGWTQECDEHAEGRVETPAGEPKGASALPREVRLCGLSRPPDAPLERAPRGIRSRDVRPRQHRGARAAPRLPELGPVPPRPLVRRRRRCRLAERVARATPLSLSLAAAHEDAHGRAADQRDLGSLPTVHLQAYVRGLNSAARALRKGDCIARNPFVSHSDISRALRAVRPVDDLQSSLRSPR
jgi:hypothetical protein